MARLPFFRPGRFTANMGAAAKKALSEEFGKLSPYMPARPGAEGSVAFPDFDSALNYYNSVSKNGARSHRLQRNLDGMYEVVSAHGPAPDARYSGAGDLGEWMTGKGGAHPMEPSRRSMIDALIEQERLRQFGREQDGIGNPTMSDIMGWQSPEPGGKALTKSILDYDQAMSTGSDAHFPGRPLLSVAGSIGGGGLMAYAMRQKRRQEGV